MKKSQINPAWAGCTDLQYSDKSSTFDHHCTPLLPWFLLLHSLQASGREGLTQPRASEEQHSTHFLRENCFRLKWEWMIHFSWFKEVIQNVPVAEFPQLLVCCLWELTQSLTPDWLLSTRRPVRFNPSLNGKLYSSSPVWSCHVIALLNL